MATDDAEETSESERDTATPALVAPVLASQIMREEVAPLEPEALSCRFWLASLGVCFTLLGIALPNPSFQSSVSLFAAALALLLIAVIRIPYRTRAGAAATVGGAFLISGLVVPGPLLVLVQELGLFDSVKLVFAITLLPAALLFRSHYREYRWTRAVLAIALLAALPYLFTQVDTFADTTHAGVVRLGSLLAIVTTLLGATGFMPGETKAAGSLWAALTVGVLSASFALRALSTPPDLFPGPVAYLRGSVALMAAATTASVGIYQLLAGFLAGDARRTARAVPRFSSRPPARA